MSSTTSFRTDAFKKSAQKLPTKVQIEMRQHFTTWKQKPASLQFKCLNCSADEVWSARIGENYRALATKLHTGQGKFAWMWLWVGSREDYTQMINSAAIQRKAQCAKEKYASLLKN